MSDSTIYAQASKAIHSQRDALAAQVVAQQYRLEGDRWEPYGAEGRAKSLRDVTYHLDYLSEAIAARDESLFVDYVEWTRTLFSALGLGEETLATTLRTMLQVLCTTLPPGMAGPVRQLLSSGLKRLGDPAQIPPSFLRQDAPLAELARTYLEILLSGDRRRASTHILRAVDNGTTVSDVYLHVFQPVQRELGRLWQLGEITVAQEHLATAVTQFIMSELYPRVFAAQRCGRRLLAACVGDELHELGIRMVADFFEMQGWDTYYLGASSPSSAILSAVEDHKPHLLALSVTMTFHVSTATQLIAELRSFEQHAQTPTLVGGYPFNISPQLWKRVGADAMARDAQEALSVADRLLNGQAP